MDNRFAFAILAVALTFSTASQAGALCKNRCGKAAKKITIDVQDAELVNVVRLFSDVAKLNFVVSDDVKGKVSMKLRNVPWDQALMTVLKTKGLTAIRQGNIVRIISQEQANAERAARLKLHMSCEEKAPLKTRLIPVNYGVAQEMAKLVEATLTKRGTVSVDERTNTLVVRDVDCP